MKKNLFLIIFLILLYSCSTNDEVQVPNSPNLSLATESHKLSEEEATKTLYEYLAALSTNSQLKSTTSDVEIIKCKKKSAADYDNSNSKLLKSAEATEIIETTPIYEFITSTGNNKYGFALVVGDSRFNEVIAYAPEGSLADTIYNEGLSLFLSAIPNTVYNALEQEVSLEKRTKADYWQPENGGAYITETNSYVTLGTYYSYAEFEKAYSKIGTGFASYTNVGPWDEFDTPCRFVPTQWDQIEPYNDNTYAQCPGGSTRKAKAGCGPVAIAQIMAYHKKPISYNWALMTSTQKILATASNYAGGARSEVARLMKDAGTYLETSYGCISDGTTSSGTHLSKIISGLNQFGYTANVAMYQSATIKGDSIYQNLIKNMPVLLAADKTYKNGVLLEAGHIWVVDGIFKKWRDRYRYSSTSGGDIQPYWTIYKYRERCVHIHCNWGWGGSSDGWYYTMEPTNEGYSFGQYTMFTQIKYN